MLHTLSGAYLLVIQIPLVLFLLNCISFLSLSYNNSSYILDTSPLSYNCFTSISSQVLVHFLDTVFGYVILEVLQFPILHLGLRSILAQLLNFVKSVRSVTRFFKILFLPVGIPLPQHRLS